MTHPEGTSSSSAFETSPPDMRLKIGVMGSASDGIPDEHLEMSRRLGTAIARSQCITVTGACPGLPLAAARGATEAGGLVVGISPGLSLDEHLHKYHSPSEFHDVLIFTGSGLMGREVVNIRTSDIVVIVGGSSGTLGELAIAYDEGKLIGVLNGTGGITTLIPEILAACNKDTGARIVYSDDPGELINQLLTVYRTEHYQHPSCFCETCDTQPVPAEDGSTVQCPTCGMWLRPDGAVDQRELNGEQLSFCCRRCLNEFDHTTPDDICGLGDMRK